MNDYILPWENKRLKVTYEQDLNINPNDAKPNQYYPLYIMDTLET